MKTKLLLLLVTVLASTNFYAQCSRSGTFVASSTIPMAYPISGSANITFTTGVAKDVNLESDFTTVQGADLRVYASKNIDLNAAGADAIQISGQLLNDDGSGNSGAGSSVISGARTYALTNSTTLGEYEFIVIQCIAIVARWGHVELGANSGADCNALSLDEKNT